ncbi:MAG: zinc dependent phospholipase C family protein [Desulfuromonadales bacterium]|nr:zinc dependent phospholipase C family protein [Desulfuromonadales bacterium]
MPGAYAHLTLANMLKETNLLDSIVGFPDEAKFAVMTHFCFCELGAVSPDYPYLALGDSGAARWADEMHYTRTGEVINAGIRRLQGMSGVAQEKGLAWLNKSEEKQLVKQGRKLKK